MVNCRQEMAALAYYEVAISKNKADQYEALERYPAVSSTGC